MCYVPFYIAIKITSLHLPLLLVYFLIEKMLASLKMNEARSKRTAASSVDSASSSSTVQQQSQPIPPPQKRIRFTARVRPLGELLDSFPTDEHLLHALTRPGTADDYGGAEMLMHQLLNLALENNATSSAQSRPAIEIALRALRLIAASHSPIFSASVIQMAFERCLHHAQTIASTDSASSMCSTLLAICAECAKTIPSLQQQLIAVLVDILGKPDCEFLLLTESLRLLARFFARECFTRHLSRLSHICVDLLMIGDVRVRLAALDLLNEMIGRHCMRSSTAVSQIPSETLYNSIVQCLDDRFEDIRLAALSALSTLASLQPDLPIVEEDSTASSTKQQNSTASTFANVAFGRLCHACASDRAIRVRALAASLMSRLKGVSENFIEQSLDKRTIASMRVDGSDGSMQRRGGYGVAIGDYEVDAVSLISQSACGALVHALEDEFYEVREAAIESLSRMITPERLAFARHAQDFLVDALGDEIESVVLCALRALAHAGAQLDFTEKHVSAILFTLKVASAAVRQQVHRTLAAISLRSRTTHLACCLALVENIKAFPSDTESIWACCARFGRNHAELTRANLAGLLDLHPIFLTQEAKMDDPAYIAKLLIIFAAAGADGTNCQIMRSLPEHVRSHYGYVSAQFRHLLYDYGPFGAGVDSSSNTTMAITSNSQLRRVLIRHIELLKNSFLSSPSLEHNVELATNLMRRSSGQRGDTSTALALSTGTAQFDRSDVYSPHWRFLTAVVHCLYDYCRIRRMESSSPMAQGSSTDRATVPDSGLQARSVLFNELRPRIVRLLKCFNPVPPCFVAFLRLLDLAACSTAGVDNALIHRIALLAKAAFEVLNTPNGGQREAAATSRSNAMPLPNIVERLLVQVASSMSNSGASDVGSVLISRLAAFDEALVSSLIACLSDDFLLKVSGAPMTELRVEIREPTPLVSEPAAEVRFSSNFGSTIRLRFTVTGFHRSHLTAAGLPQIAVRVTYPNQRSDILVPLSGELEIIGSDDQSADASNGSSQEVTISVNMRIPIAFPASTGACHARVSILLSSRDDGLVELTAIENGGSGPLQLLVHSKAAKGELQKRLLCAAFQ